eukprot:209576-Chlamydomonas_euryale.AAC.2
MSSCTYTPPTRCRPPSVDSYPILNSAWFHVGAPPPPPPPPGDAAEAVEGEAAAAATPAPADAAAAARSAASSRSSASRSSSRVAAFHTRPACLRVRKECVE